MRIFTRSTQTTKTDTLSAIATLVPAVLGVVQLASAVKTASTQGDRTAALQRMQAAQKEAIAARERRAYEDGVAAARKEYMERLNEIKAKFEKEKEDMAAAVATDVLQKVSALVTSPDVSSKVAQVAEVMAKASAEVRESEERIAAQNPVIKSLTIDPAQLEAAAKAALNRKRGKPTPKAPAAPTAQA
jgi:hypothetical protein